MIDLVVIMGPTASGKSALAMQLAERLGGEIISADSMQLYRGLEIGTAQPLLAERQKVRHHLVGIWDLSQKSDVFSYCKLADAAIADTVSRHKIPIVCGGTGMYLKALLYGLDDLPADPKLRRELDERYDSAAGEAALHTLMAQLDPTALAKWQNCRRRLIRALEVKMLTGKSLLSFQTGNAAGRYGFLAAWKIELPPEVLRKKIAARTEAMLASGWIDEARSAIAAGLLETPTAHQALGYRLIGQYLNGEFSRDELKQRLITATWQYARRQRTWFRHQHPDITPLQRSDLTEDEIAALKNAISRSRKGGAS